MRAFGINDNGVVVGRYSKTPLSGYTPFYHGFIFRNNIYHTLDHPTGFSHSGTELNDINSSGVIVGNWLSRDPRIGTYLEHGFIYKNGKFENPRISRCGADDRHGNQQQRSHCWMGSDKRLLHHRSVQGNVPVTE
jgi:hypothetical protein